MATLKNALETHQVWIYFTAMGCGALAGFLLSDTTAYEATITPALALMLFSTFMQVPLTEIRAALRNGRMMVALLITHFVVLPLIVTALVQFLPPDPLIRLAVLFVLLTPCIDYVISFTHLGGGNARLLLAMTPVLLGIQMLLLPLYLSLMLGDGAAGLIEAEPFLQAFFWLIALPLLAAGLVQTLGRRNARIADRIGLLDLLPVPATTVVLFIVVVSVMPQIGLAQSAALRALPVYVAFAVIAPFTGWVVARCLSLDTASTRAVSFSASYRNSLVILPLAFAVPGGAPLVPAVILTQTLTELFFLPAYLRYIPRLPVSAV